MDALNTYTEEANTQIDNFEDCMALAAAYASKNQYNEMIKLLHKALSFRPDSPLVYYNLGLAFQLKADRKKAKSCYEKAIALNPKYLQALMNLGNIYQDNFRLDEALACYQAALKSGSEEMTADILYNQAICLKEKGSLKASIQCFHQALSIRPDFAEANWNLSLTQLLEGDYFNGWKNYEWRTKKPKTTCKPHAQLECIRWNGDITSLNTDTLLVVTEQGLGDTLQFMRYVISLRLKGINVRLCAQEKLHGIIKDSEIDAAPLSPSQGSEFTGGQWIPLMSVPQYLGVSPDNPIINKPYIKTNPLIDAKWRDMLRHEARSVIGIHWQGSPAAEVTGNRGRSFPLQIFKSLSSLSGLKLLSLQKGFGSEQMDHCDFKDSFVDHQCEIDEIWDFRETASIVKSCDLVITNDTALVHLAGAMGKTTWLLLHHVPDWRWGISGDATFWYPSVRIFRQHSNRNWSNVMEIVAKELQLYITGQGKSTKSNLNLTTKGSK